MSKKGLLKKIKTNLPAGAELKGYERYDNELRKTIMRNGAVVIYGKVRVFYELNGEKKSFVMSSHLSGIEL